MCQNSVLYLCRSLFAAMFLALSFSANPVHATEVGAGERSCCAEMDDSCTECGHDCSRCLKATPGCLTEAIDATKPETRTAIAGGGLFLAFPCGMTAAMIVGPTTPIIVLGSIAWAGAGMMSSVLADTRPKKLGALVLGPVVGGVWLAKKGALWTRHQWRLWRKEKATAQAAANPPTCTVVVQPT